MTSQKFDELTLDGHNYPIWSMSVKVSLVSHEIVRALQPPQNGGPLLPNQVKYDALYINSSEITIMLFIKYVLSCVFVKKNLQKQKR